jgi:hypothetical protein
MTIACAERWPKTQSNETASETQTARQRQTEALRSNMSRKIYYRFWLLQLERFQKRIDALSVTVGG